ncbi:caspase family protein [Polyangium spumosum]|uniref:caspase family protein n=1 Tax=Polyangium spumosum TaxID=889282 RepID=UPI003B82FE51
MLICSLSTATTGGIVQNRAFVYRAVVCGVNNSIGQTPLSFAESDAQAIFRTFTGALGPADEENSKLLLGARATRGNVLRVLQAYAQRGTDYLLFYFSGHGSEDGLALADGMLEYWELHAALANLPARARLVILDACHSGAYGGLVEVGGVGDLQESWAEVLAAALPGTRVLCAARSDELSAEGGSIRMGHFTWALLEALHRGKGSLRGRDHRWVSDSEAFYLARAHLLSRWPNDAHPDCRNLSGDFPMLLSHAHAPIGRGALSIRPHARGYAADVEVVAARRTGVPMLLKCRLLDESRVEVGTETRIIVPTTNDDSGMVRFHFPRSALPYEHRQALDWGYQVPLHWAVSLVDPYHGYVLGKATRRVVYRRQNHAPLF